ncbi:glycoside hydrolase [Mycena rosella]|uniref:Glycoside hydrolase n=1 Tax=Mycena rosella TaxID=1033263 RepID=A0AAD7DBL2_MYCRO|nr:glycoside hydrolase [Mycena rosella]
MRCPTFHLLLATASTLLAHAIPHRTAGTLAVRQASNKLVFAHFMIGIVSNRQSAADFDDDMRRAKALGVDAFLGFFYASAAANGMTVFISFDFNWYNPGQGSAVDAKIAQYAGRPAQLIVDGKAFVSFTGDGIDGDFSAHDGALNWVGWETNGANKAPSGGVTVTVDYKDKAYESALSGKGYIARDCLRLVLHPLWAEVLFSKNWYRRWVEILALQPTFVEIITWNDYGESHYIRPLSLHTDDGSSKWANDMPHGGWLDMAKPFISAYKAGATSVDSFITNDQIIYWYRVAPKSLNCDSTDTTMQPAKNASGNYLEGRPDGFESMLDNVFVVTLLTAPGTVVVSSGDTAYAYTAPAGASAFSVPFHVGAQNFALRRNGTEVISATSLKLSQDVCPCGLPGRARGV